MGDVTPRLAALEHGDQNLGDQAAFGRFEGRSIGEVAGLAQALESVEQHGSGCEASAMATMAEILEEAKIVEFACVLMFLGQLAPAQLDILPAPLVVELSALMVEVFPQLVEAQAHARPEEDEHATDDGADDGAEEVRFV